MEALRLSCLQLRSFAGLKISTLIGKIADLLITIDANADNVIEPGILLLAVYGMLAVSFAPTPSISTLVSTDWKRGSLMLSAVLSGP
jgi:hypothetical protein